jgi:hypothetical protein
MNVEIRNVQAIELGEVLSNEKSEYSHRTLIIMTAEGQVMIKLYTKGHEDCLKVVL